jgi:hypothetical protein
MEASPEDQNGCQFYNQASTNLNQYIVNYNYYGDPSSNDVYPDAPNIIR